MVETQKGRYPAFEPCICTAHSHAAFARKQEKRLAFHMPMMPGPAARLKKLLIFIHRWMGVGLCVLFAMWFSSGMVLMYWDYPSVSAADRLDRAPALDPLEIRLSP